ncbi:ABC transporter ATP-binding protein [Demequina muriae]|uniref:ATP-binding cassette domain-containing protein n=1 Tax=Demequina muriae TaxID=3051664 RepID=A0ABT8GHI7_9MICO|nr:ATP-binding cassette domain-containing protein [Demequina sp. EGI L300058]MDN4480897.1 ATP-binding cassette domain-containing protein [Demequina sp. EGI L300058]
MTALEIDSLSKSYGELRALNEVSFEVPAGQIFGFVGSNGAGKTTTMRIILGVLRSDAGEVRWKGARVDADVRRRIGYMPEERGLYPRMKVGDQLVYLARLHGLSKERAVAAMEQWTQVLGVDERRGDEVDKLSLGNQQRVQLASALVHEPDILVLDEPFSGLDPVAVDVMSDVLRSQADRGVPVIFSSHQLELVERLSDRVGIVARGSMVASGPIDELRATDTSQWILALASATAPPAAPPGVSITESAPGRWLVEADSAESAQAVLASAVQQGTVTEFSPVRPTLTDLFRDVVNAPEEVA